MSKKLKYQQGGTGYQRNSPDVNNPYNIISSNKITMKGVGKKLKLIPISKNGKKGRPVTASPGDDNYYFPNAEQVLEVPQASQWDIERTDIDPNQEVTNSNESILPEDRNPYLDYNPGIGKKKSGGLTPAKAREILHDGTAQGHPLTDKQRKFFGAMSNKNYGGATEQSIHDSNNIINHFDLMKKYKGFPYGGSTNGDSGFKMGFVKTGGMINPNQREISSINHHPEYYTSVAGMENGGNIKHWKRGYSGNPDYYRLREIIPGYMQLGGSNRLVYPEYNGPTGNHNLTQEDMKLLPGHYQMGGPAIAGNYPKGFDPEVLSQYLPTGQQPLSPDQLHAMGYKQPQGSSQYETPSGNYMAYKPIQQGSPEWNNPSNPYYTSPVSTPTPRRSIPPTQTPATNSIQPVMNNFNSTNPSDISSNSYIGNIKRFTNPPTVPKSQRRGIQNLGINIHKPGANKYGFDYGGSTDHLNTPPIMFNMGGIPCKECGGSMQDGGSTNFNTDNILNDKKNNFVDWLKNTSFDAVHKEMIPHATFHHMPDGSIMSDAEMTDSMKQQGYMKKGGNWLKGAVNPAHKGYCTPMTKATCTPRRKAFAMTMKKHHGFHQDGGVNDQFLIPDYAEGGNLRKFTSNYAQDGQQVNGQRPCSEEDMHNPFSPCYDQRLLDSNNRAPVAEMNPYANTTYMGTQSDLNATNQQLHSFQNDLIQGQSNPLAVQASQFNKQSAVGDMAGPNTTTPPSSSFQSRQGMSGEDKANAGILGMELLTNAFSAKDRKAREKQLRNKTHADQVFSNVPANAGSRGDYDVNQGYFRADQMVPVQFPGASGQYYQNGGSYDKGGEFYLSDNEIQDLKNQGYDVEYLD